MNKITNGVLAVLLLLALISCSTAPVPTVREPIPFVREPVPSVKQQPFVTPIPSIQDKGTIGFIGCSNSGQTVAGYHTVGGKRLWKFDDSLPQKGNNPPFGGGTVGIWAQGAEKGNEYWTIFDAYLAKNPNTKSIWWQLCIPQRETPTYERVLPMLNAIRKRIPGVTVYVSPLPPYADNICGVTGIVGIERAHALARELAAKEEDVLLGPFMQPIRGSEIVADGCHMNDAGKERVGLQMKAFFDT